MGDQKGRPFAPEDTSQRDPLLHVLGAMGDGTSSYIEGMEAAGQRQLVASTVLPIEGSEHQALIDLGFEFGDPVDDLFREATLPEGWSKQGSDHDMWSYIVDADGQRRVSVFYKAVERS